MPYNGDYRVRLREIAKKKGKSFNDLSYSLEKNKGYISDVLRGKQNLSVDQLEILCREFDIEPRDFFETDYKSEVFLDYVFEGRRHSDDVLRSIVALLERVGGTRPDR